MFYVVFPLLCIVLRREALLLVPLVCLLILGPVNRTLFADHEPWGQYAYLSGMDGIAFGCLAALAGARIELRQRTLRIALAAGAVVACLVIVMCNEDSHTGLARFGLNVTVLEAGVALMLLALGGGIGNGPLSIGTRWVRVIGRSSYEIYLLHMVVVLGLIGLFKRLKPVMSMIPLWYLAMFLLSVLIGLIISRYYSEPLNLLLRSRHGFAPRDGKNFPRS